MREAFYAQLPKVVDWCSEGGYNTLIVQGDSNTSTGIDMDGYESCSTTLRKLWTGFKTQILKVSKSCLRGTPRTSKSFLIKTLNSTEVSRSARLEHKTGQYRELKCEAVRTVRRDNQAQLRGVSEVMESHLWSTDTRPAYTMVSGH